MKKAIVFLLILASAASVASAARSRKMSATLKGTEEVPVINTNANGSFEATLNGAETQLTYTLTYSGLRGSITQSHIHLSQKGVNGGIMLFLCSNLGNGPAGTPTCPTGSPGVVTGVLDASKVIAQAPQGLAAGDFTSVVKAIKNGTSYVNVHTDLFPGGEIRGQGQYQGPKSGEGEDLAP